MVKYHAMSLAGLFNIFMPMTIAISPNCDYYQYLIMGQEYYVYNNEYPSPYGTSTSCRWVGQSQVGTKIFVSCDVSLPSSDNCKADKLRISLTGSENFTDSHNYCGRGGISLVSQENRLSLGLSSASDSTGGNFICTLTAILDDDAGIPNGNGDNSICDCGWKKATRIFGGNDTKPNEFPAMAGIVDLQRKIVNCGGSIISDRYVLTAAHCVSGWDPADMAVLVGDHDISKGNDTTSAALYRTEGYEIHPEYNATALINDLAILRTSTVIKFSIFVGPICLPFRFTTDDFYGQTVTALGWGQLEFTGPFSDVLQKVDLLVTTNEYCSLQHPDMNVRGSQVCTFAPGKDACTHDSGGPILWFDTEKGRLHLIGVVSYGLGCGTTRPGVNTRVTSFLSWIVSRTSDAKYCVK